jgi:uncharacterized protein
MWHRQTITAITRRDRHLHGCRHCYDNHCSFGAIMNKTINVATAALVSGVIFALGLVISGMTQPAKVMGFLNMGGIFNQKTFGLWDASLAFVMGGALLVTFIAYAITPSPNKRPWFAQNFQLPTKTDIDKRLVVGAILFGIGWGLAGYCPGPAIASITTGGGTVVIFVATMVLGMWGAKKALVTR